MNLMMVIIKCYVKPFPFVMINVKHGRQIKYTTESSEMRLWWLDDQAHHIKPPLVSWWLIAASVATWDCSWGLMLRSRRKSELENVWPNKKKKSTIKLVILSTSIYPNNNNGSAHGRAAGSFVVNSICTRLVNWIFRKVSKDKTALK